MAVLCIISHRMTENILSHPTLLASRDQFQGSPLFIYIDLLGASENPVLSTRSIRNVQKSIVSFIVYPQREAVKQKNTTEKF